MDADNLGVAAVIFVWCSRSLLLKPTTAAGLGSQPRRNNIQ